MPSVNFVFLQVCVTYKESVFVSKIFCNSFANFTNFLISFGCKSNNLSSEQKLENVFILIPKIKNLTSRNSVSDFLASERTKSGVFL